MKRNLIELFRLQKYNKKNISNSSFEISQNSKKTESLAKLYFSLDSQREEKEAQQLKQAEEIADYQELEELAQNFDFLKLENFLSGDDDVYVSTLIVYETSSPKQKVMTGFKIKHFVELNFSLSKCLYLCYILCVLLAFSILPMILLSVVRNVTTVVLMAIAFFILPFLGMRISEAADTISTKRITVTEIRASKQIKLPELRLLFREFEAMRLSPKIILTSFPLSLQIDIKLTKKAKKAWQQR